MAVDKTSEPLPALVSGKEQGVLPAPHERKSVLFPVRHISPLFSIFHYSIGIGGLSRKLFLSLAVYAGIPARCEAATDYLTVSLLAFIIALMSKHIQLSKFLSFVLRHKPESIGLPMDKQGWVSVTDLMEKAKAAGQPFTQQDLEEVVVNNDKQRFAFSPDGFRLRAVQGHSLDIDLGLSPKIPPEILFHGTAAHCVETIFREGIQKRRRQFVHLSVDKETARGVGQRHGNPVIIQVEAGKLARAGHVFYLSENGIWLTGFIPARYLLPVAEKA
jgi:putative RNA 2'-phosphotransferase